MKCATEQETNSENMKVFNLSEYNSILGNFVSEIRDKEIQTDSMRFRRNIERIGEIICMELSKTLNFTTKAVTTPLGTAPTAVIDDNIVLAAILRAALPLHQGLFNYLDKAENAFVSAYRQYNNDTEFDVNIEYIASPSLDNKTLIICDTMLATGTSMLLAYKALLTKGTPKRVILASVIASQQAIDFLNQQLGNKCELWVATVDQDLNAHKYIVPGLGDAGDLAFGEKE